MSRLSIETHNRLLGFKADEIRRIAWLEEDGRPERWQAASETEKQRKFDAP